MAEILVPIVSSIYEFQSVFQMIRSTKQWRNPLMFLISLQIIIVVLLYFGSQSSDVNKTVKERECYGVSLVGKLFCHFLRKRSIQILKMNAKVSYITHLKTCIFFFVQCEVGFKICKNAFL